MLLNGKYLVETHGCYTLPYNKLLTNLASSSLTGVYWPSVNFVWTSLCLLRTATTSGQYSPVRPPRSVSKRLLINIFHIFFPCGCWGINQSRTTILHLKLPGGFVLNKFLKMKTSNLFLNTVFELKISIKC